MTFHVVEVAKHGEIDFGVGLSKKEGFSLKMCSDRAQVHLFAVSTCQDHVILDDYCGPPFCAETALVRHHILCFKFLTHFLLVARLLPFL